MNLISSTSFILALSVAVLCLDHRHMLEKRNIVKDLEAKEKDEMSKFALSTLNILDATNSKRILCEVLDGKKQFASGIVYKLKLSLVVVSDDRYSENSPFCEDEDKMICEIDVLRSYAATDYSPINAQVVKSECRSANEQFIRERRSADQDQTDLDNPSSYPVLGGPKKADVNSPDIKETADKVVVKLAQSSGASCPSKVGKILEAKTQVVAGSLTTLKMHLCPGDCVASSSSSDCKICNFKVWEKPWENFFEVTESSCEGNDAKAKKPLTVEQIQFYEFAKKYDKKYATKEEENRRFLIFRGNLKKIQLLNEAEEGTAEYGINEFADLSKSEFTRHYLGLKPSGNVIQKQAIIPDARLPQDFDWRTYNAVTPVKNQGMCGSCWAFSVTGNLEGQYAVRHKQLVSLSEQELVDCDKYDNGCMGGYMTDAYKAIEDLGGIEQESDYPYEGSNDKCSFSKTKVAVKVVDSLNITSNETQMAQWLFKNGPISVALNAFAMQFYIRGISKPWKFLCNPKDLDHGVLIVGYGQYKKLPYWIIKNSWGRFWGESGYYRLYRGSGACGVNRMASSGIVG